MQKCIKHSSSKISVAIKISLDNYDSLIDLSEHVLNVRNSLELVIQNSDGMYKILLTIFCGFAQACYHSLTQFFDLYNELISHFSTSISAKKIPTKLLSIT